ncbi:hypothetical protein CMUS01_06949 [Colletotrichum musicola]|uniref:Uncharacterized protein n=1 Tax=Colletotrichum musicola TaxID=2175873 RepID=A0A8H6KJQ5_9PEZI|nr:hypothetical protein CMUS01_06949 [Colletotrichum musicola]
MEFRSFCIVILAAMATLASARHDCSAGDCAAWSQCDRKSNDFGCTSECDDGQWTATRSASSVPRHQPPGRLCVGIVRSLDDAYLVSGYHSQPSCIYNGTLSLRGQTSCKQCAPVKSAA